MIDQPQQGNTLNVCLKDVGSHNKAVLDFFFAKLGQQTFSCVDTQDQANVLIIDYDFPEARERYETEYSSWQKPAIILSTSEVALENTIWLSKPLTSRALLDAAKSVQNLLAGGVIDTPKPANTQPTKIVESSASEKLVSLQRPVIKPVAPTINIPLVSSIAEETQEVITEEKDRQPPVDEQVDVDPEFISEAQKLRWDQLCGDFPDFDIASNLTGLQSKESLFLANLKNAVKLARQCQQGVLLNFIETKIYILPEIHRIFCLTAITSPAFVSFINNCNSGDGGKIHILSTSEIYDLNDLILKQNNALYDLESFVWTSTLLSSSGLLPKELDPKKKVGLKHWPSMTRVEQFPNAMPIAALWSTGAMSAFDVAKSLNIPQRYVFSFYNAANTLGLIEMDPEKLIKKQSTPRTAEAPRGLFSRLLKRLVGG